MYNFFGVAYKLLIIDLIFSTHIDNLTGKRTPKQIRTSLDFPKGPLLKSATCGGPPLIDL